MGSNCPPLVKQTQDTLVALLLLGLVAVGDDVPHGL